MAEYIVRSDDESESKLATYREERLGAQTTAARVHSSIREALAAEERFAALLAEGGPLAELAAYHAAKISPLTDSLSALRAGMMQIKQSMEQLEDVAPGLFPGITK